MSIFIFSLLAGLLLHQMVSVIQPKGETPEYQFGGWITIKFEPGAFVIWKACILALAIVLFFFLVTLIVAQSVHRVEGYAYRLADSFTSPRMAAAVFGGLVGLLLGNLLNRLLKKGSDYEFTSSDRLQIILIFGLVILGVGGEELLRSAAQRINKISVGTTTEISFADAPPKSSRVAAEQPNGAFKNTLGQSGGSVGLEKLYDIGSKDRSNIDRDKDFIEVLARYEKQPVPKLLDPGPLAKNVLSPIASCLLGISKRYGDDPFIERQLSRLSEALRDIAEHRRYYSQIRFNLEHAAKDLAFFAGGVRAAEFKSLHPRYSCELIISPSYDSSLPLLTDESIDQFRDSREELPYLAMAHASVLAALHHYEAAAIIMDRWIESRKDPSSVAQSWYLLRARITQGLLVDEWIRDRGTAVSSSLRKYHIDNLQAIADRIGNYAGISEMAKRNGTYKLTVGLIGASHSGDDGICDVPDLPPGIPLDPNKPDNLAKADAVERLETIYNSYLSAKTDYVDHALKHPVMKVHSASIIESAVETLMPLSLRCIGVDQDITRADHIERYVRSRLNMLDNAASFKSSDQIQSEIRDARQLLALAFQLIELKVQKAMEKAKEGPIQDRIAIVQVLETYETLLATQTELQTFSERDIAN
jgi:hypothetical protein